jgi:hypothetical protein
MEYTQDTELILSSLNKDRKELAEKLSAIDKLIKKIKYGSVNLGANRITKKGEDNDAIEVSEQDSPFPIKADLKVQVIKIFDILGEASKLYAVQEKYREITGFHVNLRETLRNLNRHQILKLIQPKNNVRGLYWIKTDWIDEQGRLKDKHKFAGFDLIYSDELIEFK